MDDLDLRGHLEDLARRVDGAAAPDLHAVRQHHARRRTRAALAVGLSFTMIAGVLAFASLRGGPHLPPVGSNVGPSPSWSLPDPITVWPGDDATGAWRQSAEGVAKRFGQSVLGWADPALEDVTGFDDSPQPQPDRIYLAHEMACPATARCPSLTIALDQGSDGRWSVVEVLQPDMSLTIPGIGPMTTLSGGAVPFDISITDDRRANVGLVATNGCRQVTSFKLGLGSDPYEMPVPEPATDDPACSDIGAGYVFVYVTDEITVPVGDPLHEAARIEYPWLTIVPVYVQMESPSPERTLSISCAADGTLNLSSSTVAASPDGVHVHIDGERGLVFRVDAHQYAPIDVLPVDRVLWLEPGSHEVTCRSAGDLTEEPLPFVVIDPNGFWTHPWITCDDGVGVDGGSERIEAAGDPADELLAAGERILRAVTQAPGSFVFGAYPASADDRRVVLVSDDGSTLAEARFAFTRGAWHLDGYSYCP